MANHVLSLLRAVQSGDLSPEDALVQLKLSPFEDLGACLFLFSRRDPFAAFRFF